MHKHIISSKHRWFSGMESIVLLLLHVSQCRFTDFEDNPSGVWKAAPGRGQRVRVGRMIALIGVGEQ